MWVGSFKQERVLTQQAPQLLARWQRNRQRKPESTRDEGCRIESAVHVVNPRVNGADSERQSPTPIGGGEAGAGSVGEGGCNSEQEPQQILCEVDKKEVEVDYLKL